jgi:hypothetical protein
MGVPAASFVIGLWTCDFVCTGGCGFGGMGSDFAPLAVAFPFNDFPKDLRAARTVFPQWSTPPPCMAAESMLSLLFFVSGLGPVEDTNRDFSASRKKDVAAAGFSVADGAASTAVAVAATVAVAAAAAVAAAGTDVVVGATGAVTTLAAATE